MPSQRDFFYGRDTDKRIQSKHSLVEQLDLSFLSRHFNTVYFAKRKKETLPLQAAAAPNLPSEGIIYKK